jgi:FlaA1/EpsC-like NDP-sugar epimerase
MLLTRLPFVEIISRNTFIRDKVIIIGAGQRGRKLSDIFRDKIKFKEIIGYIDDTCVETYIDNIPVLGNVKDAPEIIKKHKVDYFILAEDHIKRDRFFEIFKFFQSNKLTLYVSSKYLKVLYEKLKG